MRDKHKRGGVGRITRRRGGGAGVIVYRERVSDEGRVHLSNIIITKPRKEQKSEEARSGGGDTRVGWGAFWTLPGNDDAALSGAGASAGGGVGGGTRGWCRPYQSRGRRGERVGSGSSPVGVPMGTATRVCVVRTSDTRPLSTMFVRPGREGVASERGWGGSASHQGVGGGDELFPAGPMHAKAKKKNPGFGIFGDLSGPGSLALSIFSNSKKKKKTARGRRAGGGDHEDQRKRNSPG